MKSFKVGDRVTILETKKSFGEERTSLHGLMGFIASGKPLSDGGLEVKLDGGDSWFFYPEEMEHSPLPCHP